LAVVHFVFFLNEMFVEKYFFGVQLKIKFSNLEKKKISIQFNSE